MEEMSNAEMIAEINALKVRNASLENQMLTINEQIAKLLVEKHKPKNTKFSYEEFVYNPTVEYLETHVLDYEARKKLFVSMNGSIMRVSLPCLRYLVDYYIENKLNLHEMGLLDHAKCMLVSGTFEEIKYVLNTLVSNNLLNVNYFSNYDLIYEVIKRDDEELVEFFLNFCVEHSISLFPVYHCDMISRLYSSRISPVGGICLGCGFETIKRVVGIYIRNGLDINQISLCDAIPLEIICKKRCDDLEYFKMVKYFVDLYIEQNNDIMNVHMRKAVEYILSSKNHETFVYIWNVLEKHGVLLKYRIDGSPLLHKALYFNNFNTLEWAVKRWIDNNYDLQIKNSSGFTLLSSAAWGDRCYDSFKYVLDIWIKHDWDFEQKDRSGSTLLFRTTGNKRKYFLTIYRNKYGMKKMFQMLMNLEISLCEYLTLPAKSDIIERIMSTGKTDCTRKINYDDKAVIDDDECSPFLNDKKNA